MDTGIELITEERRRLREVDGYNPIIDGELLSHILSGADTPEEKVTKLMKAGGMIAMEIDRIKGIKDDDFYKLLIGMKTGDCLLRDFERHKNISHKKLKGYSMHSVCIYKFFTEYELFCANIGVVGRRDRTLFLLHLILAGYKYTRNDSYNFTFTIYRKINYGKNPCSN